VIARSVFMARSERCLPKIGVLLPAAGTRVLSLPRWVYACIRAASSHVHSHAGARARDARSRERETQGESTGTIRGSSCHCPGTNGSVLATKSVL
jgi:hypothetical protein